MLFNNLLGQSNRLAIAGGMLTIASIAINPALATTYTVNQDIGAAGHVTGNIVTDSTIGVLSSANITGWNLLLQGPGASIILTDANSGAYVIGDAVSATSTTIDFNYSDPTNSLLTFQAGGYGNGSTYWCNASYSGACYQGATVAPQFYTNPSTQVEPRTGVQSIASASGVIPTPEPAALALLGLGAAGLAVARRRAC